ncbi:reverse transcriptase [Senna tora]|uniref:Reverse transcriptase n=1 Tax=Senna tora TaxID=362788 RepID=A0A835CIR1_9FABA|nr:reverse transcriptase [Senna tora]
METKRSGQKMEEFRLRNRFQFDRTFYVDSEGKSGGLALWWKEEIDLNILLSSKNFIHSSVGSGVIEVPDYLTCVYGAPKERERRLVWDKLRGVGSSVQGSWLCIGDFNDVLCHSEKWGGKPKSTRKVMNFQRLLEDCGLFDLEYNGSSFTWFNKRTGDDFIKEKLDRALGNVQLMMAFPKAQVFINDPVGSDHGALVANLNYCDVKSRRSFKFEISWLDHPDYKEVMRNGWFKSDAMIEEVILELVRRLEDCKKGLIVWSKKVFPNNRVAIANLTAQLRDCFSDGFTESLKLKSDELIKCMEEVWEKEEKYWFQRSRVNWLTYGDSNSKFFHASFYSDLFRFGGRRDLSKVLSYVNPIISQEENNALLKEISYLEVKEAAFQLGGLKAPGPDGFSGIFYHNSWEEVGDQVFRMVKEYFEGAKKGHRASWAWSSILDGRRLLLDGACWRIGDGESVRIWKDKWVPGLPNFKLHSAPSVEDEDCKVKEVIVDGSWDLTGLRNKLDAGEIRAIHSTAIRRNRGPDKLIWPWSKDGSYVVKTGYKFARDVVEPVRSLDPSCSFVTPSSLWKAIWGVKAVPKVRNFLWRACTSSIPTGEALFRRKCAASPMCCICGKEVETIEHALLLCSWAREVWFGGPLSIRVSASLVFRFDTWVLAFLMENKDLDDSGRAAFAYTCWEVWKRRCEVIFKGVGTDVSSCILKVSIAASEAVMVRMKAVLGGSKGATLPKALDCWSFPPSGVIKINVDGSFHQASLEAGIGFIARNSSGEVGFLGSSKVFASNSFMCEALAVKKALELIQDFPDESFMLETDCEDLFKLISSPKSSSGEWQCEAIIAEVLSLIPLCQSVSFLLVRRHGNQAADWLAKSAAKGLGCYARVSDPPPPLASILALDWVLASELEAPKEGIG